MIARALRKLNAELAEKDRAGLLIGETVVEGKGGNIGNGMALSAVLVAAAKRLRAANRRRCPRSRRRFWKAFPRARPCASVARKR